MSVTQTDAVHIADQKWAPTAADYITFLGPEVACHLTNEAIERICADFVHTLSPGPTTNTIEMLHWYLAQHHRAPDRAHQVLCESWARYMDVDTWLDTVAKPLMPDQDIRAHMETYARALIPRLSAEDLNRLVHYQVPAWAD